MTNTKKVYRLLVAHRDENVRKDIVGNLNTLGYREIDETDSGIGAVEMAETGEYDLFILGTRLHDQDGVMAYIFIDESTPLKTRAIGMDGDRRNAFHWTKAGVEYFANTSSMRKDLAHLEKIVSQALGKAL